MNNKPLYEKVLVGKPRLLTVYSYGKDGLKFSHQEQLGQFEYRPLPVTAANANPYHDELGRFTTADKAVSISHCKKEIVTPHKAEMARAKLQALALKTEGSLEWAQSIERNNLQQGTYKCNLYVHDLGSRAGMKMPVTKASKGDIYPLTAGKWADPNYDIPFWTIVPLSEVMPGDVIAHTEMILSIAQQASQLAGHGTGHVGIVVEQNGRLRGISAASTAIPSGKVVINDFGFNKEKLKEGVWTARRYVGGEGINAPLEDTSGFLEWSMKVLGVLPVDTEQ